MTPQPVPERPPAKSRGASGWRLRIYDALYEADLEGRTLSRDELISECERRFNLSDTMRWWRSYSDDRPAYRRNETYREIVAVKVRLLVTGSMWRNGEIINLGTRNKPQYKMGKPPKYWHPKVYQPGRMKDYLPAAADTETRKLPRRMPTGWFAEVRAELDRPRLRDREVRALLTEALDLFEGL